MCGRVLMELQLIVADENGTSTDLVRSIVVRWPHKISEMLVAHA